MHYMQSVTLPLVRFKFDQCNKNSTRLCIDEFCMHDTYNIGINALLLGHVPTFHGLNDIYVAVANGALAATAISIVTAIATLETQLLPLL